jgi:hypothetical protein
VSSKVCESLWSGLLFSSCGDVRCACDVIYDVLVECSLWLIVRFFSDKGRRKRTGMMEHSDVLMVALFLVRFPLSCESMMS